MDVWQGMVRVGCNHIATILRLIASYKQVRMEAKYAIEAQITNDLRTFRSK